MLKYFIVALFLVGCAEADISQYDPAGVAEVSPRLNAGYYNVAIFASGGPYNATWWVGRSPVEGDDYAVNTHTDHLFTMNGGLSDPSLELVFGGGASANLNTTLHIETRALDHNSFTGALLEYTDGEVTARWVLFGSKRLPACYRYGDAGTCKEW